MNNKTFIPDYKAKTLRGPVTMAKPSIHPADCEPGSVAYSNAGIAWDVYNDHISSLPTYRADWLPESGPGEMVEGRDFRFFDSDKWVWTVCENCGWSDSGQFCAGGGQIADTGDYDDPRCPKCGSIDLEGEVPDFVPEPYSSIVTVPAAQPSEMRSADIPGVDNMLNPEEGAAYLEAKPVETVDKLEYWRTRCQLAEACLAESPCDPDITDKQIKAHAAYNSFLKNKQPASSDMYPAGFVEWVGRNCSLWATGWLVKDMEEIKLYTTAELFSGPYQDYLKQKGGK